MLVNSEYFGEHYFYVVGVIKREPTRWVTQNMAKRHKKICVTVCKSVFDRLGALNNTKTTFFRE